MFSVSNQDLDKSCEMHYVISIVLSKLLFFLSTMSINDRHNKRIREIICEIVVFFRSEWSFVVFSTRNELLWCSPNQS